MKLTQQSLQVLSKLFIAVGVLAWIPYILKELRGYEASLWPYLAVHLTFVISGSWLKRRATVDGARPVSERNRKLSLYLFIIGIGAWVPYFLIKQTLDPGIAIQPFLITHLIGIFGGIVLRFGLVKKIRERNS
jgi:hypothetical protein